MRVPKRRSEEFRKYGKPEAGPVYVTQEGMDRLLRLRVRLEQELPELIAEVQRTGAFGDFSENAAYQHAKYLLRKTHGRVASVKDRINRAVVISANAVSSGVVHIGSTVVMESGSQRFEYQILGSYESDPARGRISHHSPLGGALLGRRAGDTVSIETKAGITTNYYIHEVH